MSRLKRLDRLEKSMSAMSLEQLRSEHRHWKRHADILQGVAKKGAMKLVRNIERAIHRKKIEDEEAT